MKFTFPYSTILFLLKGVILIKSVIISLLILCSLLDIPFLFFENMRWHIRCLIDGVIDSSIDLFNKMDKFFFIFNLAIICIQPGNESVD